jgi:formylglycine-generating enzyme required for sulfatase activity
MDGMRDDDTPTPQGDCGPNCTCGAPARQSFTLDVPARKAAPTASGTHAVEQARIPAGTFLMGDSSGDRNPGDGETPVHAVRLDAFEIDATSVTNDAFAAFVDATGYRTEAEEFGFSAVFHLALTAPEADILGQPPTTPWWLGVKGADWRHPGGAGSSIDGLGDHPVVHISHNDALAYCAWAGRMLPTEAQWEYAARGGLQSRKYPWGDEEMDEGGWRVNIWQGTFPTVNTLDDGFLTTAPVRTFEPNGYGLWQPVGNVWEWCADWFDPGYYAVSPDENPAGPASGDSRVIRGGSFLCHISYCNRYRNSARSQNTPDSSMSNAGFRTVSQN